MRLEAVLEKFRDNTWVPPASIALAAILLALLTLWLDHAVLDHGGEASFFLFRGHPADARNLLNAIAVSIISVAGVVFSVMVVALQLASTQFGPRILQNFTEDRAAQVVMGMFIGTFAFALLAQWSVRESTDRSDSFVPSLSVTVAVVLAVVCMFLLIYFIDHVVHFIRASKVAARLNASAERVAENDFPSKLGEPAAEDVEVFLAGLPHSRPVRMPSDAAGFLQAIDSESLFELGGEAEFTVEMRAEIGSFLLPEEEIARIRSRVPLESPELAEQVRGAFVIGSDRTPLHDVGWALIELKDLAIKAISPALNDPTTSILALNHIAQLLVRIGRKPPVPTFRRGKSARVRLITLPVSYERLVEDALGPIRHYGARDASVAVRLLEMLGRIGSGVRLEHRRVLEEQVLEVRRLACRELEKEEKSREVVTEAAERALRRIRQPAGVDEAASR